MRPYKTIIISVTIGIVLACSITAMIVSYPAYRERGPGILSGTVPVSASDAGDTLPSKESLAAMIDANGFRSIYGHAGQGRTQYDQYAFHEGDVWYVCRYQEHDGRELRQVCMYSPDRTYIYTIMGDEETVYDDPHDEGYRFFDIDADSITEISDDGGLWVVRTDMGDVYEIDKLTRRVSGSGSDADDGGPTYRYGYDGHTVPDRFWKGLGAKADAKIIKNIRSIR